MGRKVHLEELSVMDLIGGFLIYQMDVVADMSTKSLNIKPPIARFSVINLILPNQSSNGVPAYVDSTSSK